MIAALPVQEPQPRFTRIDQLTEREQDLCRALHRGMSRVDIQDAMGISRSTLSNMVSKIYLKLGIDKERQLVLMVEREKRGGVE